MTPLRRLLVLGVNHLLDLDLITLSQELDERYAERGHVFARLAGENSVVIWANAGYGEINVGVWWNYCHERHPQANLQEPYRERFCSPSPLARRMHFRKFVGVTVGGHLERRDGKFFQGKRTGGLQSYIRRGEHLALASISDPEPKGFFHSSPPSWKASL